MKHRYRHLILSWALLLLSPALTGQEEGTIAPIRLSWQAGGDTLACRFSGELFLGEAVQSTLLSGLPVLLDLNGVIAGPQAIVYRATYRARMSYDIWEDRYQMENSSETLSFRNLDDLRQFWATFAWKLAFPRKEAAGRNDLEMRVQAKVTLLTAHQGRELRDWLFNANETEESSPTRGRDTGFQLDLNRFISLLWGSRQDTERSDLYQGKAPLAPGEDRRE